MNNEINYTPTAQGGNLQIKILLIFCMTNIITVAIRMVRRRPSERTNKLSPKDGGRQR